MFARTRSCVCMHGLTSEHHTLSPCRWPAGAEWFRSPPFPSPWRSGRRSCSVFPISTCNGNKDRTAPTPHRSACYPLQAILNTAQNIQKGQKNGNYLKLTILIIRRCCSAFLISTSNQNNILAKAIGIHAIFFRQFWTELKTCKRFKRMIILTTLGNSVYIFNAQACWLVLHVSKLSNRKRY